MPRWTRYGTKERLKDFSLRDEKREVYAPVHAFLNKTGMLLERMLRSVLQDEVALGMQDAGSQNLVRKTLKIVQGIGRIGKHNIEFLVSQGQEVEYIVPYHSDVVQAQAPGFCLYERSIFPQHLYAIDP